MREVIAYIEKEEERFLRELIEFVSIPSISAQETSKGEVGRCAAFVAGKLEEAGLENVEVIETERHPIVYGDWLKAEGKPTLLVYGHYDVQPPDPLEEWVTPPFEPIVRDDCLYGRGATDDKGQLYTHVKAVEAFMKTRGELPVNVKFVIEGEEEVGSGSLEKFLNQSGERLSSDVCIVSDSPMFARGMPSIGYGLRGLTYLEVEVRGTDHDLHSGTHGGMLDNPALVLCRMLASLKDEKGRVTIPGFYDDVRELEPDEVENFRSLPFDAEAYRKGIGAPSLFCEEGQTPLACRWARPTFDICGIHGGYIEEGAKTVLPARAVAKISFRLVPRQDSEEISRLVINHLESIAPPTVTLTVTPMEGGQPFLADREDPSFQAARRAIETGFGKPAVEVMIGGMIPIIKLFSDQLKLPVLIIGLGLTDENTHAPNEHFHLENFRWGTRTAAHLLDELK